ncbi:MAG: SulP family inorganic anion transporter [Verrucomicrobiota bacterium]
MLLTAVIMAVSMALFSSYPGMIAIPQDRVAPIFALMATLIMEEMHNAPVEKVGITVLAAIAVNTVLVGASLFLLGAYRLGNIVRYAPYPVIGGFLAGSGWLLVVGSFRVITGRAVLHLRPAGDVRIRRPGRVGARRDLRRGRLHRLVRYSHHYLTLPVIVFCSILVFYVWLGLSHHALPEARGRGWLLGTIPNAGLLHLRPLPTLFGADWLVVANQYGTLIAVALTSILSILLNTSALELATDEEIDLNQELRTAGLANLVTGMSGGMLGLPVAHALGAAHPHGGPQPAGEPLLRRGVPAAAELSAPGWPATSRSLSSAASSSTTA